MCTTLEMIDSTNSSLYRAVLVLAPHKTGSSFLSRTFNGLAKKRDQCFHIVEEKGIVNKNMIDLCTNGAVIFTRAPPNDPILLTPLLRKFDGRACRGIFAFRQPLDTIVSRYQSFTQNHGLKNGLSPLEQEKELERRQREHAMGPDEYALRYWHDVKRNHDRTREAFKTFKNAGCDTLQSKYDDMVNFPEVWIGKIARFLGIVRSEGRRSPISQQWAHLERMALAQKNVKVDSMSHTPFFYPGSYRNVLNDSTIDFLSSTLSPGDRPVLGRGTLRGIISSNG